MPQNADTWDLVHALSATEKRYVRRYASLHNDPRNVQYLLLFDQLNAQSSYDPEAIQANMDDPQFTRRYSAHKNYLHQLIRRAMRAYNAEKFSHNRIQGWISDGIFLYHKTLYAQSLKVFRRAAKRAAELGQTLTSLQILQWERRVIKRMRQPDREAQLVALSAEGERLARDLRDELTLQEQYEAEYRRNQADPNVGTLEQTNPLPAPKTIRSFQARHFLYQIHIFRARMANDNPGALEWQQEQAALWAAYPKICEEEPYRYGSVLANLLSLALKQERFDIYDEARPQLHQLRTRSEIEAFHLKQQLHYMDLFHAMNRDAFAEGTRLIPGIAKWVRKNVHRMHKSREMAFYYNFAALCFLAEDYPAALGWFRMLAADGRNAERKDIQALVQLFLFIIYFEMEETDLLESHFRAAQRFLKLYYPDSFQQWLLPELNRIFLRVPMGERTAAFSALLRATEAQPACTNWQSKDGFREVMRWLRRKAK